jgi:hypothetical protein
MATSASGAGRARGDAHDDPDEGRGGLDHDDDHDHGDDHDHSGPGPMEQRLLALETVLKRKGCIDRAALDVLIDPSQARTGARVGPHR